MTQNINETSNHLIYFVSPSGKIHSTTCRHCQPEKEGWQKLVSFLQGIEKGYQACRLCCPSKSNEIKKFSTVTTNTSESPLLSPSQIIDSVDTISENLSMETKNNIRETSLDNQKIDRVETLSNTEDNSQEKSEKKNDQLKSSAKKISEKSQNSTTKKQNKSAQTKPKEKVEKKRYKILAGNGCHQAIAEVRGILVPPTEEKQPFLLILPDGFQLEATFKNPRVTWMAYNKGDAMLGPHWFRGYPKMKDDKLVCLQIIGWDGAMPTNTRGFETWEFTGVWTAQKNLTIQRSMMMEDVRKIAKETGFIKKFKYTFTNSFEWVKNKKLWMGYVYKILCQRKGDTLEIKKVIPYACPRFKPEPKGFNKDEKNNYNRGEKKDFKPNKNKVIDT